ncbi:MAG TPA: hypothetical protein VLB49_16410 [Gemmatimonadales bacterium]|nr:hypothetical protein [Gemmatimonadales bacterium]
MRTIVAAAALALACTDSTGPRQQLPTGQLHFLMQAATAPALLSDTASFYAKVGEDRRVELFYRGLTSDTGEAFLQFEVRAITLLKRPDGSSFQPGDSILITVAVGDPSKFDFTFSPAGLQFNPADPARLKIEYNYSDHDFNEDGVEDAEDAQAEGLLAIWRREPPDTLWTRLGTLKHVELDEIEAVILSFTQFAVAW